MQSYDFVAICYENYWYQYKSNFSKQWIIF